MTSRIQFPHIYGDWQRSVWKHRGQVEPTSEASPSRATTAITLNQTTYLATVVYVGYVTDLCRYIHAVQKICGTRVADTLLQ